MLKNRSAPAGAVVPWLNYSDVPQAIAWLCGTFGFREELKTAPEPDGSIHHAQLGVGEGAVVLTTGPLQFGVSLFIPVEDVDAHFERTCQSGARIVHRLKNHAFGERQYTAEDLAGYKWTFSQSVADVDPADWGATVVQR